MKNRTVAQLIFERVKAEFALGSTKLNKAVIIDWVIEYMDGGKKKRANGDTKSRKLRLLIEANYLGVQHEGGQAYIVPAKGAPHKVEDDDFEEEEGEPEPHYPVLITKDGEKYVRIVRSMSERDELLAQGARAL